MATITHKGNTVHTLASLPAVGSTAPAFRLTRGDLSDVHLDSFGNKRKILNIVPSLDTGICAKSAARFGKEIATIPDAVLLNISADLPFAQRRFCEQQKLEHSICLSTFRAPSFGKDYGVVLTDGAMAGLLSRAVLVLDRNNTVVYGEQVSEIATEPDYEAALAALRKIGSDQ